VPDDTRPTESTRRRPHAGNRPRGPRPALGSAGRCRGGCLSETSDPHEPDTPAPHSRATRLSRPARDLAFP
jgi:hypothetical protein